MVSFRCPKELKAYIAEAAKEPHRDKTEVVTSALELDRDLSKHLKDEAERLNAFAGTIGLRMHTDLPEILARLVRKGLEAYDREKKKPR